VQKEFFYVIHVISAKNIFLEIGCLNAIFLPHVENNIASNNFGMLKNVIYENLSNKKSRLIYAYILNCKP
jgi:hypothetical protein